MAAEAEARTFVDWLKEVRKGDLNAELGEQLAELMQAVVAHDKKGLMTITLAFEPASDEMGTVRMIDNVQLKMPTAGRQRTIWFIDGDYGLTRRNPAQRTIDDELPAIGEAEGEIPNQDG